MESALLQGLHLNLIHSSFNKCPLGADTCQDQATVRAELPTLAGLLVELRGPTIPDESLQHRTFRADEDRGTRRARRQEGDCGGGTVRVAVVARVI